MANVRISDLAVVTLPLDADSFVELSAPTGGAPAYGSKKIAARDLINHIPYRYETPASGATITLAVTDRLLVINPAASLAALTVAMAAGVDQRRVRIASRQRIDALTINGSGAEVVDWPDGELPQYGAIEMLYVAAITAWVMI